MKNLSLLNNPYKSNKIIEGCSLFAMMSQAGKLYNGSDIIKAIANMHDRGNGLGGGFAAYGIYPEYKEHYAIHIMFNDETAKHNTEEFLKKNFIIDYFEEVPTKKNPKISNEPLVYRYFTRVKKEKFIQTTEEDFVVKEVMFINTEIDGAFVFSSGKNMGVFKGVGYPEDIGEYFCLHKYKGYMWTAHGRFPTNTQGWWGGAHPFNILDWTVVHNGEISSYGINRRYLEMYGYVCTMHTDTEVIAYAVDLLARRHKLPIDAVTDVFSAPLWSAIDLMDDEKKKYFTMLRQTYGSLLLNGPFTIVIAHQGEMIGLTDRIRLRPLTAATKDDILFLSSEEASIRLICKDLDKVWTPMGGEPIIGKLRNSKSESKSKLASAVSVG